MVTIWKYPLPRLCTSQKLQMPTGAKVVSADIQDGLITVWAMVFPEAPLEDVEICIYGTGHEVDNPDTLEFINTLVMNSDTVIAHVFRRISRPN